MREKIEKTFLPQCIAIGIGVEDFWNMTMRRLNPFLIADNIKRERENYFAWMGGYYTYVAVSTALSNAFRDKGQRVVNYLEKPIRITPLTPEEQMEETKMQKEKAIAYFKAMEASWNAKEGNNNGD